MSEGIKLYKIAPEVVEYYKRNVKDNENIPDDLLRKKLTRNVLLSRRLDDNNGNEVYLYGKLLILVKNNTIVEISNYTYGKLPYWYKDTVKYDMLNEALGIKPDLDKYSKAI